MTPEHRTGVKKFLYFLLGYALILGIPGIICLLSRDGEWFVLLGMIPLAVIGIVIWAFVRLKNKALALGILLGAITPVTVFFVATGGCGLVSF